MSGGRKKNTERKRSLGLLTMVALQKGDIGRVVFCHHSLCRGLCSL